MAVLTQCQKVDYSPKKFIQAILLTKILEVYLQKILKCSTSVEDNQKIRLLWKIFSKCLIGNFLNYIAKVELLYTYYIAFQWKNIIWKFKYPKNFLPKKHIKSFVFCFLTFSFIVKYISHLHWRKCKKGNRYKTRFIDNEEVLD